MYLGPIFPYNFQYPKVYFYILSVYGYLKGKIVLFLIVSINLHFSFLVDVREAGINSNFILNLAITIIIPNKIGIERMKTIRYSEKSPINSNNKIILKL